MSSRGASDFSRRFAAAIRGVMREHGVKQDQVATYLGRSKGYVSERISGKAAADTDIIDAVGELTGMDTLALMREVTRRMASMGDPSARRMSDPYSEALDELDEADRAGDPPRASRKRSS